MLRQSFGMLVKAAARTSAAPATPSASKAIRRIAPAVRRHYSESTSAQAASSAQPEQATQTAQDASGKGKAPETSASESDLQKQFEAAQAAGQKKDEKIAQLTDSYMRSRADYENLQKITQREKKQAKDYAVESLARELIGHMDILHLALRSVPADRQKKAADAPADVPDHLADLYTGVNMTSNGIEKTLLRFDVKPFDPTGEKFNPNLHEAMYMAPVPGKEPGSVLECQKKGWMLKDRVLRAAQVGVVSDSS